MCTVEVNAMDAEADLYIYVQDGRHGAADASRLVTFFVSSAPPLSRVRTVSICVRSVRCISLKAALIFSARASRMDEMYGATHWAHTLSASSQMDAGTHSTEQVKQHLSLILSADYLKTSCTISQYELVTLG